MSSATVLSVDGYPFLETKRYVMPEVMTVFREADHRTFVRLVSERNSLVWGPPAEADFAQSETVIEYACKTGKVIDRLNVMGFTLARVQREFESGRQAELDTYESWCNDGDGGKRFAHELAFWKDVAFDAYADAFRHVISNSLVWYDGTPQRSDIDPVVKYILDDHERLFGFPHNDVRCILRLACELVDHNSFVIQDITEVIDAGYYNADEQVCSSALKTLFAGHFENSRRIVLTEGASDSEILCESMKILFPHLTEYFSFLDFGATNMPGGAGTLVSVVKAIAGSGITNPVIAVFDNDTAARDATRSLVEVSLPSNLRVLHYPRLDSLCSYPTLGPGGMVSLDVNELAGSLELYLGDDVLRDEQNARLPVQWMGYCKALNRYQGEVVQKTAIHKKFRSKLTRCNTDAASINESDWTGMTRILEHLFRAFD